MVLHDSNKGMRVFIAEDLTIMASSPPVLQRCQDFNGLWVINNDNTLTMTVPLQLLVGEPKQEVASNAYDLASTVQAIQFMHAAAWYPVKDTWLKVMQWALHHVAGSHQTCSCKTLSGFNYHSERSREEAATKGAVHETGHCTSKETERGNYLSKYSMGTSCHIITRQPLYYGTLQYQRKLHRH